METPLDYDIVTEAIEQMGLGDFSEATIRDIQSLSRILEEKTGETVIHLEMGVPGLKPSDIAMKAEQEALANGCATIYPPNGGIPRIKKAASEQTSRALIISDSLSPIVNTASTLNPFFVNILPSHAAFVFTTWPIKSSSPIEIIFALTNSIFSSIVPKNFIRVTKVRILFFTWLDFNYF